MVLYSNVTSRPTPASGTVRQRQCQTVALKLNFVLILTPNLPGQENKELAFLF